MIDTVAERSRLGGLERWLHDPGVTEVMVNAGTVWVERDGAVERVGSMSDGALHAALEHILAPLGRRLDRSHPTVDARLPDGSRLCAAIAPVSVDGPCLAIRRFSTCGFPLNAFTDHEGQSVLAEAIRSRCNIVVTGATSSGKTSLLNAIAGMVPSDQRLVTLEDVAELQVQHPHVVRLEARRPTPDGVGGVDLQHLLHTALRLRPDRLIVGEVRGAEAPTLLQAMNTGHDGSLTTLHANSAADGLDRLASLVVQHAPGWPIAVVHHQIGRAIDVVIHVCRDGTGRRWITEIADVQLVDGRPNADVVWSPGGPAVAIRRDAR